MSQTLIQTRLDAYFCDLDSDADIKIQGDGNHFHVRVVSDAFLNQSQVKRQQQIYRGLGDAITSGAVHAVELQLFTRDEWAKVKPFHA